MVQIEDSINIPNLEIMECNTSPDVHGHARTCPRTFDGVCLLSHIGDALTTLKHLMVYLLIFQAYFYLFLTDNLSKQSFLSIEYLCKHAIGLDGKLADPLFSLDFANVRTLARAW